MQWTELHVLFSSLDKHGLEKVPPAAVLSRTGGWRATRPSGFARGKSGFAAFSIQEVCAKKSALTGNGC
jgi:hypothetical protein